MELEAKNNTDRLDAKLKMKKIDGENERKTVAKEDLPEMKISVRLPKLEFKKLK